MSYVPSQYNYPPTYYAQPVASAMRPKTSVDSVKIDIINPKASMEPVGQPAPVAAYPANYYVPNYAPTYPYYPTYPLVNPNSANGQNIYNTYNPQTSYVTNPNNITPPQAPQQVQQPEVPVQPPQQVQPQPQQQVQPKQPDNKKPTMTTEKEPINPAEKPEAPKTSAGVPESLIRAIDNALKSPDPQVRLRAATKLAREFEENPAVASDPALTALLNRVLKDPHQNVRLLGEIALKVNATGNNETRKIIQDMTQSRSAFGYDSLAANDILLKMAGEGQEVAEGQQDQSTAINAGVDYAKPLNFFA